MEKQYEVAKNLRLHRQHYDIGAKVTLEEDEAAELVDSGVLIAPKVNALAATKPTATTPAPAIETPKETEKPAAAPLKAAPPKAVPKAEAKTAKPKTMEGRKTK